MGVIRSGSNLRPECLLLSHYRHSGILLAGIQGSLTAADVLLDSGLKRAGMTICVCPKLLLLRSDLSQLSLLIAPVGNGGSRDIRGFDHRESFQAVAAEARAAEGLLPGEGFDQDSMHAGEEKRALNHPPRCDQ